MDRLPAEIRLRILKAVVANTCRLSAYATVCREWQDVMEKLNFRQLKLQQTCLNEFEFLITSRIRNLVRHVWLNIKLPRYGCGACNMSEPMWREEDNNCIVRAAICRLFSILSRWNPSSPGITLELSVQSPSDTEHWFKQYEFGQAGQQRHTDHGNRYPLNDSRHFWNEGHLTQSPSQLAIERVFATTDLGICHARLPEVPIVTTFAIRRQVRRLFTAPSLGRLLQKLPRLRCIVYEPWRDWESAVQKEYDARLSELITYGLPRNLKNLSIFEDFDVDHAYSYLGDTWHSKEIRPNNRQLEVALAWKSQRLEQLSVSYMIEATRFFQAINSNSSWTWDHLKSLSLTSHLLHSTKSVKDVNDLFKCAGKIALRMSSLRALVIWNGGVGQACAFLYTRERDASSITWRGNWSFPLSSDVIEAWRSVAAATRRPLRVVTERIDGEILSHGDAIHRLELPRDVIGPTSIYQIRIEARRRRGLW